jgi:phage head maturation protease
LIAGLAIPYGVICKSPVDGGIFCERIERGAFAWSAKYGVVAGTQTPIALLVNHDPGRKLAEVGQGLRIWETTEGIQLEADCRLPAGFQGSSFGFDPLEFRRGPGLCKILTLGVLREISLIVSPEVPAYRQTTNGIKEV